MQENTYKYRAVWVITGFGLLLRSYHYLRNPAIWHDEAANILNVLRKSFPELLGPLYASTTGPPLFLWVQKFAVICLGDSTYALRLVSLLASCGALLLMALLAPRVLKPVPAAACVLVVACSDRLLWHAAEARHYSSDVLIASALTLLFMITENWTIQRRAWLFTCLAPAVIFASYPGIFLLGGIALAFLFLLFRGQQNTSAWLALIALVVFSTGACLVLFFTTVSSQRTAALDAAWLHAFPDWRDPARLPQWFIASSLGVFDYLARPIGGILLFVVCVGAASWWRANPRELVLFLVAPLALAAMAGLLHAYPYTGARTMAFAMPAVALMVGAGTQRAIEWTDGFPIRRWLATSLIILPLLSSLLLSIYRVWVPWPRADTSGAATYVLEHRTKNEPVTANHWEYEYYFRRLDGWFYPGLGLLREEKPPERYWIVLTGGDSNFATTIANNVRPARVLERREFFRTTVLRIGNSPN